MSMSKKTKTRPKPVEPTRQEVVFFPKEAFGSHRKGIPLAEKPQRIWTAMPTDVKPELPVKMVHLQTGFLEDFLHDWNYHNGTLRYYSRVTSGDVYLVLEYP